MRLLHCSFLAGFLFVLPLTSSLAEPPLRIGPVDGVTDSWRSVPDEIELPVGVTVQMEFSWGLNSADLNADGRVDLLDYATLSLCFSAPGGRQPGACDAGNYLAADLDADGDVDIDDANAFNQAMHNPLPFAVQSVTWIGAREVSRTASRTRARLELREPGDHVVRVEATLSDPISQRTVQQSREITIHVADSSATEITADWTQENTPAARGTAADPAVQLLVNAFNPDGKDLNALIAGDVVLFEVGVTVDPSYTSPNQSGGTGNRGIATLVYNVNSAEAASQGFFLNPMQDAPSGFDLLGNPASVSSPFYLPSPTSVQAQYGGGWGFDRSGFPGGGNVTTTPGSVIAAGVAAPLTFSADVNPSFSGLQPNARLDVGAGLYTFPPDDPIAGGLQGGFGQDLSNTDGLVPGDGTWMFQTGVIDTTGWTEQTYNFDVILPQGGAAIFDGAVDYSTDQTGFRVAVPLSELGNATFSFSLQVADCNTNDVPDDQDILSGTSQDCNANGTPDECEPDADCNGNGILDACDTAQGTSSDCNTNSLPDECEPDEDCNSNGIRDICDIGQGTSDDCNFNGVPDECDPPVSNVLFVDASATGANTGESWTNAFTDLQGALAAAECYGPSITELWVAAGTYTPDRGTGDRNASFQLRSAMALYGGFMGSETERDQRDSDANTTILSGDLADDDDPDFMNNGENSHRVVIASIVDSTAVLDGFTISGGNASGQPSRGGGMFVQSGNPTVKNCTFVGNRARLGAGLYLSGSARATVSNCVFQENLADMSGGGFFNSLGSPSLFNCTFVRNTAAGDLGGGGMSNFEGDPQLVDCLFLHNAATGLSIDSIGGGMTSVSGSPVLTGCVFIGNSVSLSSGGGMAVGLGNPILRSCVFHNNVALLSSGGGLALLDSNPEIVNCVFSANQAGTAGGGIFNDTRGGKIAPVGSDPALVNCILWDNIDAGGTDESAQMHTELGNPTVDYSSIQGLTGALGGVGNIGLDPLFKSDGIHLCPDSPCINAGDPNFASQPGETDIDGDPRVIGGRVDMGADEHAECRLNGAPDECDPDCNGNAVPDECDIAEGTSEDCNVNAVPDECDIANGTSQDLNSDGVPDECQSWPLDIKPGACPNSFNRSSHGVLPVALLGSDSFDVAQIDLSSLLLSRADGVGGSVAPHEGPPGPQTVTEDVATPFVGQSCDCHALTADGFTDLSMKFRTDDLVAALELNSLTPGALVELVVTGTLLDGSEFVASDCVRLVPPGTGPGRLAVNSNLPQAWINITPLDTQLDGGGFGSFERTWPQSTVVTLAAEEFYLGQRFVGWKFNGEFASRDMTSDLTVQNETQTVDAVFRRIGDITSDELINLNDFALFAVCFGSTWGFNEQTACSNEALASSDLDRNGVIDLRDFAIFAIHFGT